MAAGIFLHLDPWGNWLEISTLGAEVRDGSQKLLKEVFNWIVKFLNDFLPALLITSSWLLWDMACYGDWNWGKLGKIVQDWQRLNYVVDTYRSSHQMHMCLCVYISQPLSVSLGHVTEFWPVRCEQKWHKHIGRAPQKHLIGSSSKLSSHATLTHGVVCSKWRCYKREIAP